MRKIYVSAEGTILVPVNVKLDVILNSSGDRSVQNMLTHLSKGNVRADFDGEVESFTIQSISGHEIPDRGEIGVEESLYEAVQDHIDGSNGFEIHDHEVTDSK